MEELELNKVYCMDCLKGMRLLPDNSVDSIVTDPPYGLGFMGKKWDTFDKSQFGKQGEEGINDLKIKKNFNILPRYNSDGLYTFTLKWAKECLRVLKPGGFLLSFSGTRTYHKICSGIEDAGFEIRDMISWLYGSGFPKSLNIGKAINKIDGVKFDSKPASGVGFMNTNDDGYHQTLNQLEQVGESSDRAKKWEGFGTSLKPAHEPIVVARKPLSEKNVALNVLKWGCGGINIDECRIGTEKHIVRGGGSSLKPEWGWNEHNMQQIDKSVVGRFPANIILDEEVGRMLDKQSGESNGDKRTKKLSGKINKTLYDGGWNCEDSPNYSDNGGASRFFYCAKSSKSERNKGCESLNDKNVDIQQPHNSKSLDERYSMKSKNNHPTVKPIKLMEYLVRLVTRKGGVVLDPFGGSGSTGIACVKQGFKFILFDNEQDYVDIANARIKSYMIQTKLK